MLEIVIVVVVLALLYGNALGMVLSIWWVLRRAGVTRIGVVAYKPAAWLASALFGLVVIAIVFGIAATPQSPEASSTSWRGAYGRSWSGSEGYGGPGWYGPGVGRSPWSKETDPFSWQDRSSVEQHLGQFPPGNAVLAAPPEVKQYEGFDVALSMGRENMGKLFKDTNKVVGGGADFGFARRIRMSRRMKAELIGNGFVVEENGPQEQSVAQRGLTFWRWRVHSDWPGKRLLVARIHTLIESDGREDALSMEIATIEISVKCNLSEFLSRNWMGVVGSLVMPVVSLLGWTKNRKSGLVPPKK